MKRYFLLLFLLTLPAFAEENVTKCADWDRITISDYYLHNNVWGKGSLQGYKQCIFKDPASGTFGWTWEWPEGAPDVAAYPEVLFGFSPWNDSSTSPSLPRKVGKIKKALISHDLSLEAEGIYNLAFDAWTTSEERPTEKVITSEIMIWLTHQTLRPDGTSEESVTIRGEAYAFYHGKPPHASWPYYAFIKKNDRLSGTTDLKAFMDFLVKRKFLSREDFLACIDFGNEVVLGKGRTTFKKYQVEVK